MMKSKCTRIYDKNNRLRYELNNSEETIFKYDNFGNIIYAKNWNIKNGDIWYEYYQEFDDKNNLIHFKDVENKQEYWIEYDELNNPIVKKYSNGEITKYIYDDFGNILKEIDEMNNILIEYNNNYDKD